MQRMSTVDAMFLANENAREPRQLASLAIVEDPEQTLTYQRLIHTLEKRIDLVPRYRQVALRVPGSLSTPMWADDEDFDLSLHVRRSALPKPGTIGGLRELVGRLIARRLDPERPLWELYLIEGLADGRVALLFKTHQALVDGSETIDLAQVLLEETQHERHIPHEEWHPRGRPSRAGLVAASVRKNVARPAEALRIAEFHAGRVFNSVPGVRSRTPEGRGLLWRELSAYRRFSSLSTDLADYRAVREHHGGSVNDVVLAAIAGGIRGWMLTRAEPVTAKTRFRAMVPMSVSADEGIPTSLGSQVRGQLVSLPVGETNPVMRLHQVSYALKAHREAGSAVRATSLARLPGFASSTFHAVGARAAELEAARGHQIVITNVPGPQEPVFMAGKRLSEIYPCIPLSGRRPLAIGVTSYAGQVFYGIVADREAIPDIDVLSACIRDALIELVESVGEQRIRAPRGRSRPRGRS